MSTDNDTIVAAIDARLQAIGSRPDELKVQSGIAMSQGQQEAALAAAVEGARLGGEITVLQMTRSALTGDDNSPHPGHTHDVPMVLHALEASVRTQVFQHRARTAHVEAIVDATAWLVRLADGDCPEDLLG